MDTQNALYYCAQSANTSPSISNSMAHALKKCTQSGIFQFDIKSPSDFKMLSAQKLKTLMQKYKLPAYNRYSRFHRPSLALILNVFKRYHDGCEFIFFPVSIVIIPTRLLCQMQVNSSRAEFLSTMSKFMKRMTFVIACLRPSQKVKVGIFTGSRAVDGKEMYKKA